MFGRKHFRDADTMFLRFFDPWYDDEMRRIKGFRATRPDMLELDAPVRSAAEITPLTAEACESTREQIDQMRDAALEDWPTFLGVKPPLGEPWLAAADSYFNRKRVTDLARNSNPDDFANDYVVNVCEFGAVLSSVMIAARPRLEWVYSVPYWESALFDPKSRCLIPPFHWAIKKFSSYGINDGVVNKLNACLEALGS